MFGDIKENSIQRLHSTFVLPIRVDDTKGNTQDYSIINIIALGNTSCVQPMYYVSYLGSFSPGSDVVMYGLSKPTSDNIYRDT